MRLPRFLLLFFLCFFSSRLIAQDAGVHSVQSALNIRKERSSKSPVATVFKGGDTFRAGFLSKNWYAVFAADGPLPSEDKAIGYAYAPIVESLAKVSPSSLATSTQTPPPAEKKTSKESTSLWPIFVVGFLVYFFRRKKGKGQRTKVAPRGESPWAASEVVSVKLSIRTSEAAPPGALAWLGEGTTLKVGRHEIRNPNVYAGPKRDESDASYIDTTLKIAPRPAEESEKFGYWPKYSELAPGHRARYLEWLASGKPTTSNFGYVFLYFYGLERRALVDKTDLQFVVDEVGRLLAAHSTSGSFLGYASSFLTFLVANHIKDSNSPMVQKAISILDPSRLEGAMAAMLAHHQELATPISPELAMAIAGNDPGAVRSVITRRVPEEFEALFKEQYLKLFPSGLSLVRESGSQAVSYRPASPSLLGGHFSAKVPKVQVSSGDQKAIVALWNLSVDALKAYSKKVASGAPTSREAFEALPETLRKTSEHPDREAWETLVESAPRSGAVSVLAISDLAASRGIEQRGKLTLSESRALATTAESLGWLFEPDARFTQRPYDWTGKVGVAAASGVSSQSRSSEYRAAALIMEAGIAIAGADGTVQDSEMDYITKYLGGQFMLGGDDARRLECLRHALLGASPSMSSLKKRLVEGLNQSQREALAKYLVGVVASKGSIERVELKALQNAFKSLSVDVTVLERLLGEVQAKDELVQVTKASPRRSGERLTPSAQSPKGDVVSLDEAAVARILAETREVSKMLAEVLGAEEDPMPSREATPIQKSVGEEARASTPKDAGRYSGLPAKYHGFVDRLAHKEKWPKSELNELAKTCGLMPADAVDSVNEWADERIGDLVIQEVENEFAVATKLIRARAA